MALAKRQVKPSRSSTAFRRMAPPSELACGWSNFAMIGLEIPWTWRALCAIQAVAIEPPRFCAMSRLVNALFAHFRGSMALFFHPSRIIRASAPSVHGAHATRDGVDAQAVICIYIYTSAGEPSVGNPHSAGRRPKKQKVRPRLLTVTTRGGDPRCEDRSKWRP